MQDFMKTQFLHNATAFSDDPCRRRVAPRLPKSPILSPVQDGPVTCKCWQPKYSNEAKMGHASYLTSVGFLCGMKVGSDFLASSSPTLGGRILPKRNRKLHEPDLACLTASRRRQCLCNAVAFGLPLNE